MRTFTSPYENIKISESYFLLKSKIYVVYNNFFCGHINLRRKIVKYIKLLIAT